MLPSASAGREEGQRAYIGVQAGAEELTLHSLAQWAQGILHHQLHVQRTVDVVQHISDGSHAQVSIHDNFDPSGRLVVMELVTASLEGQEAILPAEMRRMLRNGNRISSKEILLIPSRSTPSSLNISFVEAWLSKDASHLHTSI